MNDSDDLWNELNRDYQDPIPPPVYEPAPVPVLQVDMSPFITIAQAVEVMKTKIENLEKMLEERDKQLKESLQQNNALLGHFATIREKKNDFNKRRREELRRRDNSSKRFKQTELVPNASDNKSIRYR